MNTEPKISIGILPAPLEDVMTDEFEEKSKKLLLLHRYAPDLKNALFELWKAVESGKSTDKAMSNAMVALKRSEGF